MSTSEPIKNPSQATAGSLLQRQSVTMSNLVDESQVAYHSALTDKKLSPNEPMGKNTSDHSFMGQDAFRHAYSSARASQAFTAPVANLLGRGNEMLAAATRENNDKRDNAADIGMDLHNNRVGREIYDKLGRNATPEQIRDAVIEAGRNGQLILSTKDPRALKEYDSQYDMKALGGAHDGVVAAKRGVENAYQGAKDTYHAVVDQADKGMQRLAQSIEGYKGALKDAIAQAGHSPFFTFSQDQMKAGERQAKDFHPQVVNAVADTVTMGRERTMSREQFKDHMEPVTKHGGNDHTQQREQSRVQEQHREQRSSQRQAEREMSMSMGH